MLGFQGGVSIPLVKGGVKAPPAKRQCRAGPKAGARRGFTPAQNQLWEAGGWSGFRVEEDVLEWAIDHDVQEPIVVELDDGSVAFAITAGESRL